jgi:hypothetical protein
MGLRETLRKAAGLLVEMPAEAESAPTEAGSPPTGSPPKVGGGSGGGSASAEIDRLFAELEGKSGGGARPARTVEQIVRETPGPNLDEIGAGEGPAPSVTAPDGTVDFAALYQQALLPTASYSAEQMLEMLASLPADLPLETRRQTVQVTLASMGKAIGATPETIVADASRKLAALNAYSEQLARQTSEFVANTELESAALQAQIDEKRRAIQANQHQQTQATTACEREADRLDDILEFFSLDVPPSKHAPPA